MSLQDASNDAATYLDASQELEEDESFEECAEFYDVMMADDDAYMEAIQWMADDGCESLSDSDGEWGGSKHGKAANLNRDFEGAFNWLIQHYFSAVRSTYDESQFECRFHLPRPIFNIIREAIMGEGSFVQKYSSVTKIKGINPLVRLAACMRKLAYGSALFL